MTDQATPGIGDNNPPPYRPDVVQAHGAKAAEFLDAAGAWLDAGEIEDETQAAKLTDFLTGLKQLGKDAEADRKADKKPYDEAGKGVQGAYIPILEKVTKAVNKVQPLMTGWLEKVEQEKAEEAARVRAEAEAKAKAAADAAAAAASRNDLSGEADAEAAMKAAQELEKAATKIERAKPTQASATGGGRSASLRTSWRAEVSNLRIAFMMFADHPDVEALLIRLAEAKARQSDFDPETQKIEGFVLHKERKAA